MSEPSFDLLIVYKNSTKKTVGKVVKYGIHEIHNRLFYFVSTTGYISWVPIYSVNFFGRKCDYNQPTIEDERNQEILRTCGRYPG